MSSSPPPHHLSTTNSFGARAVNNSITNSPVISNPIVNDLMANNSIANNPNLRSNSARNYSQQMEKNDSSSLTQHNPHSVHSDYSSDYLAMNQDRSRSLESPIRPGRGRPRKITSGQSLNQRPTGNMLPKRSTPRSSLAPPGATPSMLISIPGHHGGPGGSESGMLLGSTNTPALVFKCPVVQCERIYATKLALKRHFQVYQHEALYDGPLESVLVMPSANGKEDSNSPNQGESGNADGQEATAKGQSGLSISATISSEEDPLNSHLRRILPKLHKCPVLQCLEKFPTENELASHWKHTHPTLKGSLGEWSSLLYEFDTIQLTPVEHPATYLKELEINPGCTAAWQFHSIFQVLGPQPALKLSQVVAQLRGRLGAALAAKSSALLLDDLMLGLLLQITLYELMPKAFLLTRDPDPGRVSISPEYDVWKDEPWLRAIDAESAQTLLHYGSAHTSRTFKRKISSTSPNDPGGEEGSDSHSGSSSTAAASIEDRFVCQVPGCAKVFASLPAYKYHMHHYEHDLEILIRCSVLLRRVLFAPLGGGELGPGFSPERWLFRLLAQAPGEGSYSVWDRIICLPDVVHILHGYIDQQLPLLFSFHFSKKRLLGLTPNEFLLRRDEQPDLLRRELLDALVERRAKDARRKRPEPQSLNTVADVNFDHNHQVTLSSHHQQFFPNSSSEFITTGGHLSDEADVSQRSFISLLCKFVVPEQLERYQARRVLAGVVAPGTTSTVSSTLLVSPAPGGFSFSGPFEEPCDFPLLAPETRPAQLCVYLSAATDLSINNPSDLSNIPIATNTETDAGPAVSFEVAPCSGVHLSPTDAIAYGDGLPLSSTDFFPLIVPTKEYALTWLAVGGGSFLSYLQSSKRASIYFWTIFLSFDSMTLGYRIAKAPILSSVLIPLDNPTSGQIDQSGSISTSQQDQSDADSDANDREPIVALKWCPFLFNTTTTGQVGAAIATSSTRALLAVLYASGSISIFSISKKLFNFTS